MASIWTVPSDSDKVDLVYTDATGASHPFWIKLKRRLNVGEARKAATAGWQGLSNPGAKGGGTEIKIDWKATTFARTEAYLLDWSLADDRGEKLPATRETMETLHEDVFAIIEKAVSDHVEALEREKKVPSSSESSSSEPSATSA